MIFPDRIKRGDEIAIISPATKVKEEYVRGAVDFLSRRGYIPKIMEGVLGPSSGSYASSREQRLSDLHESLTDPLVKAIFCARGGYGCVHLISEISPEVVADNPKWMIGFSDISALHALWWSAGVASLHAPMAKHLATEDEGHPCTTALFRILENGPEMDYSFPSSRFNRIGEARGILRGGNLAVLNSLADTPYDILHVGEDEDVILFVEDISEAIYAVERMLTRLYLSGAFGRLRGLVIGQFTEYKPDMNHPDMETMIDLFLKRYGIDHIPVAFNFPVGHVSMNYPLIEGAGIILSVSEESVKLKTL